ncbi:MAG: EVE domain-containing protein [Chloroflexi bacterium]|nr:EVE domain-containing protein [Chloroflexota bacterium]
MTEYVKFWFTENDPHVTRNNHGVWVKTSVSNARRMLAGNIQSGDLVFIYETRYNRDHSISTGRSKVVALTKVKELPFENGDWVRVAETSWLAALDCRENEAHAITGKGAFRKFGIGGLNVMELSPTMALRFMDYCKSDADHKRLVNLYFPKEVDDIEEQRRIEKALPVVYQKTPRKPEFIRTRGGQKVKTNPGIAKRRMILADYKCEIEPSHETFKSHVTNNNYVEAHHLVPLRAQDDFGEYGLDHEANIFSLCPNCHRLLHHAIMEERQALLTKLFRLRKEDLGHAGISLTIDELLGYYE